MFSSGTWNVDGCPPALSVQRQQIMGWAVFGSPHLTRLVSAFHRTEETTRHLYHNRVQNGI